MMATPSSPALKRSQAARGLGVHAPSPRRGRRGSAVHFDEITSIYPLEPGNDVFPDTQQLVGTLTSEPEDDDDQAGSGKCHTCNTLLERRSVRRFFRVCSVLNLLSLAFSAPLRVCPLPAAEGNSTEEDKSCEGVFIQFVVIAVVDLILAVLYTVQLVMRLQYNIFVWYTHRKKALAIHDSAESDSGSQTCKNLIRLFILILVTCSLWYSVAIGVYRSHSIKTQSEPLQYYFYFPLILRSFVAISAMKLFVHLKIPATALNGLLKNIKNRWKQLFFVAIFYFFFIYMYALIGVQWLGGLNQQCFVKMEDGTYLPSIPLLHCSTVDNSTPIHNCFNNTNMVCIEAKDSGPLDITYRNTVYLGQFRFILDALFAVYEASSWELWSFMQYNALNGAPRNITVVLLFYITMVFFLVVFVQQSIFLVVIIESFADLRSDEAVESSNKQQDKPTIVLYEQRGGSNEISFKHIKTQESITAFKKKLNKYYFCVVEKAFILLVLADAVVTATKHTGMSDKWAEVLKYWQLVVSILFVLEVVGLFVFHLLAMPMQLLLFVKNYYFWYLFIIALGGLAGGIPISYNNPMTPGHWLSLFQALRLPRALRLVPQIRRFVSSIIGDGVRLLIVVLLVLVFLVWFAVVSMQIFGYLNPEEGCERLGSEMFRDFLHSFQSMFQLLMQEGWSQLFSEIMCRRNISFFFINIYFIILHLFASLILLNFFVAVILDNLDYDEEEKKIKLEEAEKNTEKVQTVPYHLRIFKLCGPKKIPVPKLSSADAPNITEADVRNFYNIGEVPDLPLGLIAEQPPIVPSEAVSYHRRSSELSPPELLTENSSSSSGGMGGGILAQQGKYLGVQEILSHIKAYREHSRENEENRPGQSVRGSGTGGGDFIGANATMLVSEYDEYREKYRLFDTALFCMPPEHKVRRLCKYILTKQMEEPASKPPKASEGQSAAKSAFNLTIYLIRYLVSALPYFTWLMVIVTTAALIVQMHEVYTRDDKPFTYIWMMDLFFILFTVVELILKILANGLFFNPHAAIQSAWDFIDWLIVLATLVVMIIYLQACDFQMELDVTYRNIPPWFLVLLTLRAFRPFRLISLVPTLRHVIYELLLGWRKFLMAGILLIFFVFMFASLGVQLFGGVDSPEGFCNDPTMKATNTCVGNFLINIQTSPQSLPINDTNDTYIYAPRVWYGYRRNFRFYDTPNAFLTLFEVLTLEGWLDVRDLFGNSGDVFKNEEAAWFMSFYIHIFVFLGVNFVLQLFVGIVVNNFNEHKPDHSALLTVSQKRWTDLLQRISLTRPIKKPPPPRDNKFRMCLYKIFLSPYYKHFSTVFIIVNSMLLWAPWVNTPVELHEATQILMSISVAFACLFSIEVLLKILAFQKNYFHSWRNVFDCGLSLLGVMYMIPAIIYLSTSGSSLLKLTSIADTALVFAVLKLFTILMKYSVLQNLLITVFSTFYRSRALMVVLISTLLLFTFLGNLHFGGIRSGEAIDYSMITFNGTFMSLPLLIRVVTGEDWHTIFRDCMVQEPYCSKEMGTCGDVFGAILYFLTYYIFVSFILLNVIIAVLLENFSIFYNEDDTELNHAVVRDYKLNWLCYDKTASGSISSDKIKLLLRMLKLNEFFTYITNENGVEERKKYSLSSDSIILREMSEELRRGKQQQQQQQGGHSEGVVLAGGKGQEDKEHNIPFQDVLKMLAYRAEDITQRLVPHQLYTREELEHSVQFDVAEQCILKWIKKFVKPVVIQNQEKQRRITIIGPTRPKRTEEGVLWPPLIEDGGLDVTPEESDDETEESANLMDESYERLVNAGGGEGDKWQDWFHVQRDWMNNVDENPENYFDDNL